MIDVCNMCRKACEPRYKIPKHPICISCQPFIGFILCCSCLNLCELYSDDYPCLGCRKRIPSTRHIPSRDSLVLQNPDNMIKPCAKCGEKDVGVYREIDLFCSLCYRNRNNCYMCEFCFKMYVEAYKICVWCVDIMEA